MRRASTQLREGLINRLRTRTDPETVQTTMKGMSAVRFLAANDNVEDHRDSDNDASEEDEPQADGGDVFVLPMTAAGAKAIIDMGYDSSASTSCPARCASPW
jgi:hypothetical protein